MKPSVVFHLMWVAAFFLLIVGSRAVGDEVSWSTVDGGGAMFSVGGSFSLGGSIGQPDANDTPFMSGGNFELTGGFWPVANVCYCPGDLNRDGRLNGRDVQQFVTCIISGGDCACADVDAANGVNLNDVPIFVADLLTGGNCP
jgi:hypothetical protein